MRWRLSTYVCMYIWTLAGGIWQVRCVASEGEYILPVPGKKGKEGGESEER